MINSLQIIEVINDLIGALMVVYFFDRAIPAKNINNRKIYTTIVIVFYTLISSNTINNIVPYLEGYKIILFMIGYFVLILIYPVIFKRGRLSEKFFLSSFYISIMLGTSFIIYSIVAKLFNITFDKILLTVNVNRTIAMVLIKIIVLLTINMFLRNINNINFFGHLKNRTLYVGGIVLILNHMLIFVIERDILKNEDSINVSMLAIVLILCIIQLLSISMLNTISNEIGEKVILKMNLERKIHDEEIIYMYKELIGWKHDFKNHMVMIQGLLEGSTKEDAILYINEIEDRTRNLDKSIYTDNIAINSILMNKIKVAQENEIKVNLDIKITLDIKISNVDVCIILGNLFDNSIEACNLIKGEKYINLKIVSENNKLVIKISNNTNGYTNEINGKFITTKRNTISGIGLIQVDSIVKSYSGYINRKHENNVFSTYIMIQYEI